VLDNAETILLTQMKIQKLTEWVIIQGLSHMVNYSKVGELKHNSCLILTSREKPKDIALEGKPAGAIAPAWRLPSTDGRESKLREIFWLRTGLATLIQSYAGNPLALKIVSTTIHDLFAGYLQILSQRTIIFGDLQDLLDQQFNRLSELEQQMMYW